MRLTAKFAAAFLLVALVPIAALGYLIYGPANEALERQVLEDLTLVAEAKEGHLYSFVEGIKGRALDFSSDGLIRDSVEAMAKLDSTDLRYAELQRELSRHLKRNKMPLDTSIHAIVVIDSRGRIIAATEEKAVGRDESGEEYFVQGSKGTYVSDVHVSQHVALSEHPYIAASAPLAGRESGAPLGVIVNFYDTRELDKMLSGEFQIEKGTVSGTRGRRETLDVYLVNKEKLLITPSRFGGGVMKQRVETLPVLECAAGRETASIYKNFLGREVAGASMCIPGMGWTLVAEIDTGEALALVLVFRENLIATGAAVTLLASLLAYLIAVGISRPAVALSKAARKLAEGDFSVRAAVESQDEIGELAASFNKMAQELEQLYSNLGRKIGELSFLREISELFEREAKAEKIYSSVTEKIAEMLDAEQCCIILYDKDKMEFTAQAPAYGMTKEQLRAMRTSLDDAVRTLERWAGNEPLVSNDPSKDERLASDAVTKFEERSLLLAELKVEGEFLGWLRIANKRSGGFTEEDARLAKIVASRLASALHLKHAQEALRASEERLHSIVQSANDAIILSDSSGKIIGWNNGAQKIFGYAQNEVLDKPLRMLMPQRYREAYERGLERVRATGETYIVGKTVELDGLRKDGSEFPLELSLAAWKIGNETFYSGIIRDITERKREEEELQLLQTTTRVISEAKDFSSALETALQKVCEATGWAYGEAWIPSQDGMRLELSASWLGAAKGLERFAEASKEFTFGQGVGLPGRAWASREPAWVKDVALDSNFSRAQLALEAGIKGAVAVPVLAGGEVAAVMIFFEFKPLGEEDEQMIDVVSTVSTQLGSLIQRKRAEEAIKVYAAKLEQSNSLKDLFTDVMRHDLLNPAGLIRNYAELLLEEAEDEETKEYALSIKRSTEKLIGMIEDASKLARVESAEKLEMKEVELCKVLRSAASGFQSVLESKKMKLEYARCDTCTARVNPFIEDVFSNLISNAIKYSPEGKKVELGVIDEGESCRIYVKDWGYGIPNEDKARLFTRFQRADKRGIKGTGLGLAIVKRIVDLHKGKVWVEDNPEGGSIFIVELPKNHGNKKI